MSIDGVDHRSFVDEDIVDLSGPMSSVNRLPNLTPYRRPILTLLSDGALLTSAPRTITLEQIRNDVLSAILQDLRRLVAGADHSLRPTIARLPFGVPDLDAALGGGLARGGVHELSPKTPQDQGCMTGLAIILAALAAGSEKPIVWIQHDFVACEYGGLYGLGLERLGLSLKRLVTLRVPREPLALWAMEEALKCRAAAAIIVELPGEGAAADLVATRRLVLAAEEGQALGLLLRMKTTAIPSAAMTRWEVASAPSVRDCFGGVGKPAFDLSLLRNRRGPGGRWTLYWNDHGFTPVPLDLAAPSPNRSDHARAQAG